MGRPKGSKNKIPARFLEAARKHKILPLDYMLKFLNDEDNDKRERMQAAIAAAPYVHPKLASVTLEVDGEVAITEVARPYINADEVKRLPKTNGKGNGAQH